MEEQSNTTTRTFKEINLNDFTNLRKQLFAEYLFVYHINDGYFITDLDQIHSKHQLLFQKIYTKVMQMNLMIVDSCFSILLSDIVLDVFLNNISSFAQYTSHKKKITIDDTEFDQYYIKYKLNYFINQLLFSNIASDEIYKGNIEVNKTFFLKNQSSEIQYFTIYERYELQDLLFNQMTLEIDFSKSYIRETSANICLRILFK